jgi:hypothetical protein
MHPRTMSEISAAFPIGVDDHEDMMRALSLLVTVPAISKKSIEQEYYYGLHLP